MGIELVKPLLLYIVGPIALVGLVYFMGYNSGANAVKRSLYEAQAKVSVSLREAEEKNEEIRHEQDKERMAVSNYDLERIVCMFNSHFSGSTRRCRPHKTIASENKGI